MFERETEDKFPKKIYSKTTIIVWIVVIVALVVGAKLLIGFMSTPDPW